MTWDFFSSLTQFQQYLALYGFMYPFFKALITLQDFSPTFSGDRLSYLLFIGGVWKLRPSRFGVVYMQCNRSAYTHR